MIGGKRGSAYSFRFGNEVVCVLIGFSFSQRRLVLSDMYFSYPSKAPTSMKFSEGCHVSAVWEACFFWFTMPQVIPMSVALQCNTLVGAPVVSCLLRFW